MIQAMRRPESQESNPADPISFDEVFTELPLLHPTPRSWAELAAARLPEFLADHAICEQQVAMYALSLAGYYPDDAELVERAAALAAEEVQHFRRVVAILRRRGWPLGGRRKNVWAQSLRARIVLEDVRLQDVLSTVSPQAAGWICRRSTCL